MWEHFVINYKILGLGKVEKAKTRQTERTEECGFGLGRCTENSRKRREAALRLAGHVCPPAFSLTETLPERKKNRPPFYRKL